jgi:hypothetical protein
VGINAGTGACFPEEDNDDDHEEEEQELEQSIQAN